MTKKTKPARVVIDPLAAATDWEALPSLTEILTKGSPAEVRSHLDPMGRMLLGGSLPPPVMSSWLGNALIAIAAGNDANKELRITGKKQITVSQIAKERYLVKALRGQGLSRDEALGVVSRMTSLDVDWDGKLRDEDQRDALEQRLKRSRKSK